MNEIQFKNNKIFENNYITLNITIDKLYILYFCIISVWSLNNKLKNLFEKIIENLFLIIILFRINIEDIINICNEYNNNRYIIIIFNDNVY